MNATPATSGQSSRACPECGARLDPHHPPRQYRMEHLRAHAVLHARVVWPSGEDDQLSRELAPLEHKVAEALVAEYRSRVYYWEA